MSPPAAEPPRVVHLETVYQGWGRYLRATIRLSDGEEVVREVQDHGRTVGVLPYDPERRTALMISIVRAPLLVAGRSEPLLECAAGGIDDASAEDAARREALEEVGVTLGDLELVAETWPSPGVSAERMSLFLAPYAAADRTGAGGGVRSEGETLTVHELPLAELWREVEAGTLADAKALILTMALHHRRPDLFD